MLCTPRFMQMHLVEAELFHADEWMDRHDEAKSLFTILQTLQKKETFTLLPSMKAEGEVVV